MQLGFWRVHNTVRQEFSVIHRFLILARHNVELLLRVFREAMHSLIEVVSSQLHFEWENMTGEWAGHMESFMGAFIGVGRLAHGQFFGSLVFTYESIELGNSY